MVPTYSMALALLTHVNLEASTRRGVIMSIGPSEMRAFLMFISMLFMIQARASCNPDPFKVKVHSDKEAMYFSLGYVSALHPESNYKFIETHHRKCGWGIELKEKNDNGKTIIVRVSIYGKGYIESND